MSVKEDCQAERDLIKTEFENEKAQHDITKDVIQNKMKRAFSQFNNH